MYKLHFTKIQFHNLRDLTYETQHPEKLAILCSFSTSATQLSPFDNMRSTGGKILPCGQRQIENFLRGEI